MDRIRLRALSFNLWVDHEPQARLDAAIPEIAALAPDIIFLQEVREAPGLPHTAIQLQEALGFPGLTFARMTLAGAAATQGIAIVSRHPLTDIKVTKLPYPEKTLRYRLLSARIELGGRTLGVHVTHLRWQPSATKIRTAQARAIVEALRHYPCDAHLLGGDFNAPADGPELAPLHARLLDTFAALRPGDPGLTWAASNPHTALVTKFGIVPDRRIDLLMCSPPALGGIHELHEARVVLDKPVDGRWLSDHYGLLVDLSLDAPAPLEA